jgi:putative tryptophan/tyrosine transport system substrate-binding protein
MVFAPATTWPCVLKGAGLLAIVLLASPCPCHAANSKKVLLLLSGNSPVYQKVADNTIRRIDRRCKALFASCPNFTFEKITVADADTVIPDEYYLVITFGTRAAVFAEASGKQDHLILSMLPKKSAIAGESIKSLQGAIKLYLDQPYSRYFELIKATMPRFSRIGLLLHRSDTNEEQLLINAAYASGLILKIEHVESAQDIGESLSHLLSDIDVFLALPDSRIHNNKTISNILTTAYRNHIPVVAFSSAYVKAGATEAIYTSLDDISHQTSDVFMKLITHKTKLPMIQQAKYFSISFNFEVARSLGISIRSPSTVESIILQGDKQ